MCRGTMGERDEEPFTVPVALAFVNNLYYLNKSPSVFRNGTGRGVLTAWEFARYAEVSLWGQL